MFDTDNIQFKTFSLLFLGIVGATGVLSNSDPGIFQRFFGETHPLSAIFLSGVIGFFLLAFLLHNYGFTIYKKGSLKNVFRYSWLIVVFTGIAILVDSMIVFPEDMNILFPESLLFYPAIAFFVETLFHVLPLSLLLLLLIFFFKKGTLEKVIWISIIIVALLEPVYQVFFMKGFPVWAMVVTGLNLFIFNLVQLYIFKKIDFISMYAFRLIYYLIWHILWGHFRLELLF